MAEDDFAALSGDERKALAGKRFAICVGSFYPDLALRLTKGALAGFGDGGVEPGSIEAFEVPGAFELPYAAQLAARSERFDGVACLGAVIRGETSHYDHVCAESARGIQRVQLDTGVPCAFGVLTVENMDQALERSGGDKRDQGRNAAMAVMRMALLADELGA
jgi:6,7-dimethyl-8-ribityllumazine synthase